MEGDGLGPLHPNSWAIDQFFEKKEPVLSRSMWNTVSLGAPKGDPELTPKVYVAVLQKISLQNSKYDLTPPLQQSNTVITSKAA